MEYTVAKRGWVLLNDKNKVVAEGTKADIEKIAFQKVLTGHTIKGMEQPEAVEEERPLI